MFDECDVNFILDECENWQLNVTHLKLTRLSVVAAEQRRVLTSFRLEVVAAECLIKAYLIERWCSQIAGTGDMGRTNSRRRKSSTWSNNIYQDVMTDDVTPVGCVPVDAAGNVDLSLTSSAPLRVVHTSDTHLQHDRLLQAGPDSGDGGGGGGLPDGDVLVHSGDFNRYKANCCVRSQHVEDLLHQVDQFFASFPHTVKLFVAGNHEACLEGVSVELIQRHLPHCVYLCDSAHTHAGLNFYGSPYTASRFMTFAKGFTEPWRRLKRRWDMIPDSTDVLVTHMPPLGVLDLASEKLPNKAPALFRLKSALLPPSTCQTCRFVHPGREHWGCPALRDTVLNRVKPKLHLFGHVHESYGTLQRDDTVFSNGAFLLKQKYNVFDYYTPEG